MEENNEQNNNANTEEVKEEIKSTTNETAKEETKNTTNETAKAKGTKTKNNNSNNATGAVKEFFVNIAIQMAILCGITRRGKGFCGFFAARPCPPRNGADRGRVTPAPRRRSRRSRRRRCPRSARRPAGAPAHAP